MEALPVVGEHGERSVGEEQLDREVHGEEGDERGLVALPDGVVEDGAVVVVPPHTPLGEGAVLGPGEGVL